MMMLDGLGFIVMLLNLLLHKVAIASSLLHRMTYEMLTFPLTLWSSGPSGASDTIFKCHHGVQTKLQSQQTNITTLNSWLIHESRIIFATPPIIINAQIVYLVYL